MVRVWLQPWMTIGATLSGSPDDAGEKFLGIYQWGGSSAGHGDPGSAVPPAIVTGYDLMPRPSSGVVYRIAELGAGLSFIHQKGDIPDIWNFTPTPGGLRFSSGAVPGGVIVPYGAGASLQAVSMDVRIGAIYAKSPSEFYFGYYLYGTSGVEAQAWASNIFQKVWLNGAFFKAFVETMLVGDLSSPDAAAVVTGAAMYQITVLTSPYFSNVPHGTTIRGFQQPDGNFMFQNGTAIGASTIEGEAAAGNIVVLIRPGERGAIATAATATATATSPVIPPVAAPSVQTAGGLTPAQGVAPPPPSGSGIFGLALVGGLVILLLSALSSKRRRRRTA